LALLRQPDVRRRDADAQKYIRRLAMRMTAVREMRRTPWVHNTRFTISVITNSGPEQHPQVR